MDEFARSREDENLFADEFKPTSGTNIEGSFQKSNPLEIIGLTNLHKESKKMNQFSTGCRQNEDSKSHHCRLKGRNKTPQNVPEFSWSSATPSSPWKHTISTTKIQISKPISNEPNLNMSTTRPKSTLKNVSSETIRMPAVRGDRSLTGGLSKVKLTEAELSAKLEKMRILNASKIEKHRMEEADQAAFQSREKEINMGLSEKQKREHAQRLELAKERLKNRDLKYRGMQKREWDLRKMNSSVIKTDDDKKITDTTGENTDLKICGLETSWYSSKYNPASYRSDAEPSGRNNLFNSDSMTPLLNSSMRNVSDNPSSIEAHSDASLSTLEYLSISLEPRKESSDWGDEMTVPRDDIQAKVSVAG